MSDVRIIEKTEDLIKWRKSAQGKIAFVPTMGALHEGHAELLRTARKKCDLVVLSIFVNPTQFGPNEDLDRYPRTLADDIKMAEREEVDIAFVPTPDQIYPKGFSTYVEETALSLPLCGPHRPGHFRGVTTVVLKLFNLVRPHLAVFGLKDGQQFLVIKKMVSDLALDIEIFGTETVRESDGLAMSSRNRFLSTDERKKSATIYRTLQTIKREILEGRSIQEVLQKKADELMKAGFQVEYLDCRQTSDLAVAKNPSSNEELVLAVAAKLGKTRLIDNVIFRYSTE